jgi:hypothetical protein
LQVTVRSLSVRSTRRFALALVTLCLAAMRSTAAQTQAGTPADPRRVFASRAELEAEAVQAEAQHRSSEAWLLRTRLQRGDFQEGDRIVVSLQGLAAFNDTLVVRAGKTVQFPRMEDLSLEGVLRSELPGKIAGHLARYLRDSTARVVPLVRLAVLGSVRGPGYYFVPADALLSDVLMRAGGPAPDADFGKIEIRRGADVMWSPSDVRTALADGMSVDRLHLRAGDEIQVGEKRMTNWLSTTQIAVSLMSIAFGVYAFARR